MFSEKKLKISPIFSISNLSKSIKKPQETLPTFQTIPGLFYFDNFISKEEATELLNEINKKTWNLTLKRRTQHYGYYYDYKTSHLDLSAKTEPLPDFIKFILPKLQALEILKDFNPDQLIINEYLPGQGISSHIDKVSDFEEKICSISLGSDVIMEFRKGGEKNEVRLRENSIVILTEDARFKWSHGIPARKSDKLNGITQERRSRVSLTFRIKKNKE